MIYYLLLCYIWNSGYLCDSYNKILELHKESRECVWLKSMIEHIEATCSLSSERMNETIIYDIAQLKEGDLQKNEDINNR